MNPDSLSVERHRTALRRPELSRPVRLALDSGLIRSEHSVFDYGCGHGGDVRRLQSLCVQCSGWDPVHHPEGRRTPADVVNLGYVVNVIEDAGERADTLRRAWALANQLLIVSAQLTADLKPTELRPYRDGCLTRLNTFQKYYEQQELRAWIDRELQTVSIPAAPGVFYVFKDSGVAQNYLLSRLRRRIAIPRQRQSDVLFERHHLLFTALMDFYVEHGRLPEVMELESGLELVEALGSIKRAFAVVRNVTGTEQWDQIREERAQDLLVYMALAKFDGRPSFSVLPEELQLDVRAHFSSYKNGCARADELLFAVGNADEVDRACRRSSIGKQTPTALYFHVNVLPRLSSLLRVYEGCARAYVGSVEDANIIKMHRAKPQISYLSYPAFERDPHPALTESLKVRFRGLQIEYRDYRESDNPFILHRKEEFVADDHAGKSKFARLTAQEQRLGLFANPQLIGTREQWNQLLGAARLEQRGHRLVRA